MYSECGLIGQQESAGKLGGGWECGFFSGELQDRAPLYNMCKVGGGEGRAGPRQDQALHLVHRSRDGRKQSSPGWRSRQRCLPNGPHLVIGS